MLEHNKCDMLKHNLRLRLIPNPFANFFGNDVDRIGNFDFFTDGSHHFLRQLFVVETRDRAGNHQSSLAIFDLQVVEFVERAIRQSRLRARLNVARRENSHITPRSFQDPRGTCARAGDSAKRAVQESTPAETSSGNLQAHAAAPLHSSGQTPLKNRTDGINGEYFKLPVNLCPIRRQVNPS